MQLVTKSKTGDRAEVRPAVEQAWSSSSAGELDHCVWDYHCLFVPGLLKTCLEADTAHAIFSVFVHLICIYAYTRNHQLALKLCKLPVYNCQCCHWVAILGFTNAQPACFSSSFLWLFNNGAALVYMKRSPRWHLSWLSLEVFVQSLTNCRHGACYLFDSRNKHWWQRGAQAPMSHWHAGHLRCC